MNDNPHSWMADAICRGQTDLFFPAHAERPAARQAREDAAKALCAQCPVKVPCTEAGRSGSLNSEHSPEHGRWGEYVGV